MPAPAFSPMRIDALARSLAARPYSPPSKMLPPALSHIGYDGYRSHRFDRGQAIWAGDAAQFIAEPMMRGWLFKEKVDLYAVEGGRAALVPFDPTRFSFPQGTEAPTDPATGFSGVRFLHPINRPGVMDEIAVFQGASYFRAVARDQLYGLSARGLGIGTGGPKEEFPIFRAFWLEHPTEDSVRVHALLDGPSVAGAYHMIIRPGDETRFDIEARLYPRVAINAPGVAPMSSMFLFSGGGPRFDDFRHAVHDSDGLEIWTGRGERLWRPLANPNGVQISVFDDLNPRGFGLMQRARAFEDYQDMEARYEKRPSLWVEPMGNWGPGSVQLLEMPAHDETGDNVAAFWRPKAPWIPGREVRLAYRLRWGERSSAPNDVARVIATRSGSDVVGGKVTSRRRYAIDFEGTPALSRLQDVRPVASVSAGTMTPVRLEALPGGRIVRATFEFAPPASGVAELRLALAGKSETWLSRWSA
ncbi:glucan biosynthesis protein [Flavisphingomonas formosensis]|uniref:glucan biosynthesis protein n=1 Tax=Flavisphingomonas formosensis TaxID=861534 RepID=UPI0012F78FCD|nr:glucan biosynthesis protein [Sphingomonas formosensis]